MIKAQYYDQYNEENHIQPQCSPYNLLQEYRLQNLRMFYQMAHPQLLLNLLQCNHVEGFLEDLDVNLVEELVGDSELRPTERYWKARYIGTYVFGYVYVIRITFHVENLKVLQNTKTQKCWIAFS